MLSRFKRESLRRSFESRWPLLLVALGFLIILCSRLLGVGQTPDRFSPVFWVASVLVPLVAVLALFCKSTSTTRAYAASTIIVSLSVRAGVFLYDGGWSAPGVFLIPIGLVLQLVKRPRRLE